MTLFSAYQRSALLHKLSSEQYDLLVIGGGITGAGVALDAASRGIRTALIEKQDFAAGTSSRSTKLIHGGLRYLKQLEFGLVKEVGRERAILHRNSIHLVVPEKMLLPVIAGGTFGYWPASFGLWLYDLFAGVKKNERRKMLTSSQTQVYEPILKKENLKGAGLYFEYRTDDARLTMEVIKTASKYGALCTSYVQAEKIVYDNGKAGGAICRDLFTKNEFNVKASMVVNAAGPWVDEMRSMDHSLTAGRLHLTKGVHIVVARDKLPLRQAIYFDAPGGRMVFAIPGGKTTYIGTTDTDYAGNIEHPKVNAEDVAYLLAAVNNMFTVAPVSGRDVIASWAGLRPLIHKEGKSPSELSRKDELFISPSGLISVAGGKLSGYRKMAQRVINRVAQKLYELSGVDFGRCLTEDIVLCGGEFGSEKELNSFIDKIADRMTSVNLPREEAQRLVHLFGRQAEIITDKMKSFPADDLSVALAKAELWFCVTNEATYSLLDFFTRRSARMYFDPDSVEKLFPLLLNDMRDYSGWDELRCREEKDKITGMLEGMRKF